MPPPRQGRRLAMPTGFGVAQAARPVTISPYLYVSVNLFLLRLHLPQLMRLFKFLRQLPRSQIFANVSQPLLNLEQGMLEIFLIADCDVPPHRIRTGRNPRHLPQSAP